MCAGGTGTGANDRHSFLGRIKGTTCPFGPAIAHKETAFRAPLDVIPVPLRRGNATKPPSIRRWERGISPQELSAKPVELVSRCIRNSSREGDAVLDPLAGSGATIPPVACELLGRRGYRPWSSIPDTATSL